MARVDLLQLRSRLAAELRQFDQPHEQEFNSRRDAEAQRVAAEESAWRIPLENPAVVSGELARSNHAREWQKRLAQDPEFAVSALERTLLKMQKVGADPSVAAAQALEDVALLALPPGSRVEVTNALDKFSMRVAFKMSSTTAGEAGAGTKHYAMTAMRSEAEETCAYVIKEIFDYCGARGIARLSVSCNHGVGYSNVPKAATDAERKELEKRSRVIMACIYRVVIDESKAAFVPSWREISVSRVRTMMRVDYDGMAGLSLTNSVGTAVAEDPNMPLEF
jgi:hypothetical protein